jgi:hypothetical protein
MAKTVIFIDGKAWPWTELLKLRREQQKARRQAQPPLFNDLYDDSRPVSQKTADSRYQNPMLFEVE